MRRWGAVVLALALLLLLSLLLHREPSAREARRTPRPEPVPLPASPDPEPVVAASAEPKPPPAPPSKPPPVVPPAPVPAPQYLELGTGIVRGTVRVLGTPPPRKKIKTDSDPKCAEIRAEPPLSDVIVVDPQGGVKWAFVYVAQGINNQPPKRLLPPVLLDQIGCVFEPHVLGLQVGQPLNVYNNDTLLHNVHALALENKEFNFGLPTSGQMETRIFGVPEVMIKIKCDVHPWMVAWIGVLDHPYFAVTDATGSYGIPGLPAGRYTVQVWHEVYATVTREIDVGPGTDIRLDFVLDAKKR